MNNKKILVPVDFSEVAKTVIEMAVFIAKKSHMTITLLHVEKNKGSEDIFAKMKSLVNEIIPSSTVQFEFIVKQGNIFTEVANEANDELYKLLVVGSHGFKGLREKLFGADILKLLRGIPVPVITIQKDCKIPVRGFETILFPVGSHKAFDHLIEAAISFANIFDSEIHLYSVEKPGVKMSQAILENIEKAKNEFDRKGIKYGRVKETQDSFSVGYSKQIMDYANRTNISLIAFMANPTREHYYFADTDKIVILTNDSLIPVLSVNDKRVDLS